MRVAVAGAAGRIGRVVCAGLAATLLRSRQQHALLTVRGTLIAAIHEFMRRDGFLHVDAPIFTPSALTSALRATTMPSLLDSTTTGLPSSAGLNTRSQDT